MSVKLDEVATLVEGKLVGDGSVRIHDVGSVEEAKPGDLAALDHEKHLPASRESKASALLVAPRFSDQITLPHVVVAEPQLALNLVIEKLGLNAAVGKPGIHPTAVVDAGALLKSRVTIGPYAIIGAGATLEEGCTVDSHAVIHPGARLGRRCRVQSHAVIGSAVEMGDDVVVGSTAVIGGEGFGFGFSSKGAVRLHHIGQVILGDRVEIGNGTTIDRARFGVTRIGNDVKIDSQVHIGHNCSIGDRTVIAAQVGFAGSTHIGKNCRIGGQVGFAGHLRIADGTSIAAKSGVASDVTEPGEYLGFWMKDRTTALRELVSVGKLPEALKALKLLRAQVDEISATLGNNGESKGANG